jgi:hypothetical protein
MNQSLKTILTAYRKNQSFKTILTVYRKINKNINKDREKSNPQKINYLI